MRCANARYRQKRTLDEHPPQRYTAVGVIFMSEIQFIFTDFETFYSKEYTLKKLDAPSYILDPRFEAICLGVAEGFENPSYIIDGPNIPAFVQALKYRRDQGA